MTTGSDRSRVLTLVFTDLADSTALKTERGDAVVGDLIARHREHVTRLAAECGGRVIDWAGDGCFLTYETPSAAVQFSLALQQAHHRETDLPGVRIGAHMGEVTDKPGPENTTRVEGLAVDLAARISGLALPGQILMSSAVFNSARQRLRGEQFGADIVWLAHGAYELKGFDEPMDLCEAGIDGVSPLTAPTGSEKAHRAVTPAEEDTLGWRPAVELSVPRRENWILAEQIGEGGYGEVWLARHEKTKAKRVFKFCFEPERVRGLKREVVLFRLLKESLGHRDDIAQILDWEFERSPYFLESEYTEGGDLKAWAQGRGGINNVPLETRLELVAQAAVALGAAHSVGVLHKDIKPANLLVEEIKERGVPRISLTDFGIGLITDPSALLGKGITAAGMTDTLIGSSSSDSASGAGTRLYMAPEVVEGKTATTQSDIYALGVVLYQMVIGDFSRAIAPGWERGIDDDLLREDIAACIDGDAGKRLASATELAERLRTIDARRTARRKADRAKRRRRLLVAAAVVGPIITLAVAVVALQQNRLAADRLLVAQESERVHAQETALGYKTDLAQVQTLIEKNEPDLARDVLANVPKRLRHWEWGYLMTQCASRLNASFTSPAESPFHSAAFSPDGASVVTGAWDGTATVWDRSTLEARFSVKGADEPLLQVAFTPDGSKLVTAAERDGIRVWDVESQTELFHFENPAVSIKYAQFFPDGTRVITAADGDDAKVWDVATGELLYTAQGQIDEGPENRLAGLRRLFSPDGARFVTQQRGDSGSVAAYVHDASTGEHILTLKRAGGIIGWMANFSPDGTHVAVGGDAMGILYDASTGAEVMRFDAPIVDFTGDGKYLITNDEEFNTLRDVSTGDIVTRLPHWTETSYDQYSYAEPFEPDRANRVYSSLTQEVRAEFPDGERVIGLDLDGARAATMRFGPGDQPHERLDTRGPDDPSRVATLWNVDEQSAIRTEEVLLFHFGPGEKRCFVALPGNGGAVWNTVTGEDIQSWDRLGHEVVGARLNREGTLLITVGSDRQARVWDVESGDMLAALTGHDGILGSFAFGPSGNVLFVNYNAATGTIWDLETGLAKRQIDGQNLLGLPFNPEETRVVTASGDRMPVVWDTRTGERLFRLVGHEDNSFISAFSPDGTRIVTGAYDNIRVWDAQTGHELFALGGGTSNVGLAARFSPDGAYIAERHRGDNVIRIYDSRTGVQLHEVNNQNFRTRGMSQLVFSASGNQFLGQNAASTSVYDTVSGAQLFTVHHGDPSGGKDFQYNSSGTELLVLTTDGEVQLWDTTVQDDSSALRQRLAEEHTGSNGGLIVETDGEGARLVDADSGETIAIADVAPHNIASATASQDGRRVILVSNDGVARILDTATGVELMTLSVDSSRQLRFSNDDAALYAADENGITNIWRAEPWHDTADD